MTVAEFWRIPLHDERNSGEFRYGRMACGRSVMGPTTVAALALIAGPSVDGAIHLRAQELVEQLASPVFRVREEAAKDLVELGYRARSALTEGARNDDPEVADRSRRLLPQAIAWHIDHLLDTFLANADTPIPSELPGAGRWAKLLSD